MDCGPNTFTVLHTCISVFSLVSLGSEYRENNAVKQLIKGYVSSSRRVAVHLFSLPTGKEDR